VGGTGLLRFGFGFGGGGGTYTGSGWLLLTHSVIVPPADATFVGL
jgi:hypothetical protein